MEEGNPCCSEWKKRFSKLEEKRNALRQAVKLLEHQTDKLQAENLQLKRAFEQEKLQAKLEKEAKEKELSIRQELEKENNSLKMELSSLREDEHLRNPDVSHNQLLETRILEGESEVKRLKGLLDKGKKKLELEKKKVEAEKNRAIGACGLLEVEKSKVEKEKKLCEIERKKAEEYRLGLEKSKSEASDAREALIAERTKVESERQKVIKEKKRADRERARAEEARRLSEAERKKELDEKERVNHLSEQLEIERRKREDLQKEMDRKISIGNAKGSICLKDNTRTGNITIENDSVKLLTEKLKLEKKQVKHARRVANLQEAENDLLRRELNLLKQEFIHFSCHLNLLGGHLSQRVKGIAGLAKMGQRAKPMDFSPSRDFGNIILHDHKRPGENKLTQTRSATFEPFNHTNTARDARRECTGHLFQEVGGNLSYQTSGINSGLESPIRDSVRRKSQSPVACSTTTSFSDRPFMGSQERGLLAVTTTKSAEKNLKCIDVDMSGEFTELRQDKCPCVLAEKIEQDHAHEKMAPYLQPTLYKENETVESEHRKKRRKIEDTLESVACLYSEDKKLQSIIEEKLGILGGLIRGKKSLPKSVCCHAKELSKSSNNVHNHSKNSTEFNKKSYHLSKRKESKKQKTNLLFLGKKSNQDTNLQNIESIGASFRTENAQSACRDARKEVGCLVEDEAVDIFFNQENEQSLPSIKDMIHGDLMKLLELDNDADEERYRLAMARPLSPTLPILKPRRLPTCEVDDSHLDSSILGKSIEDGNKILTVTHMSDSADLEIDVDKLKSNVSGHCQVVDSDDVNVCLKDTCRDVVTSYSKVSGPHFNARDISMLQNASCNLDNYCHSRIPTPIASVCNQPILTTQTTERGVDLQIERENGETCSVLAPVHAIDLDDRKLTTEGKNLDNATETGQALACKGLELCAFSESAKETITSMHKEVSNTCVTTDGFSDQRTSLLFVTFSDTKDEESILRIFHLMNVLISQSSLFLQGNDVLGNILSASAFCRDLQSEEKTSVVLSMLLDHFSGPASAEFESFFSGDACSGSFEAQLRTVISDSETRTKFLEICTIDCLLKLIEDFLIHRKFFAYIIPKDQLDQGYLGASSYCMGKGKVHISSKSATVNQFVAAIVILASICKVFNHVDFLWEVSYKILRSCSNDVSWVLTVIHGFAHVCGVRFFTLVENNLLKITVKSVVLLLELRYGSSHPLQSASEKVPAFSPCKECPFTQGAVSLDKLVHILLSKIEKYLSAPSKVPSMRTVSECPGETADKSVHNSELCPHEDCDRSCCMVKYEVVMHEFNCVASDELCSFVDVISLLELAACYMAWDWTYGNIVPQLLEMLQSCSVEEYSSALLVLIGKLGRMGVDAEGYEHSDVAELRSRISTFLDLYSPRSSSLLPQVAAVCAIIDLLPKSFEEIVGDHDIIFERSCNDARSVQSWFIQLTDEQKLLLSNLFKYSDVQKK